MSLAAAIHGFQSGEAPLETLLETLLGIEGFYLLGQSQGEDGSVMPALVKVDNVVMGVLLSEPGAAVEAGERLGLFEEGIQVHAMEIPRDHLFPILQAAGAAGLVFNLGREDEEAVIGPDLFGFLAAEAALEDLAALSALLVWIVPHEGKPMLHVHTGAGRELVPVFSREEYAEVYRQGLFNANRQLPPEDRTTLDIEAESAHVLPMPMGHLVQHLLGSSALGVMVDPGQPTALLLVRPQLEKLKQRLDEKL